MPEQDDLIKLIETTANGLKDIQSNITTIHEQGVKQTQDLEEKQITIKNLNEKLQGLESQSKTLEAEKGALATEKTALEADLRQQLQSLEVEKEALTTENTALEADLRQQLQSLEVEKEALTTENTALEADLQQQLQSLEVEKEALITENTALEADLQQQLQSLEAEKTSLFTEKDSLTGELQGKAAEFDNLVRQFENISAEFKSLRNKEESSLDVQQLLTLYVALVEDIYAARPHIRILWLLHGDKGTTGMSRDEVTKASGFEPIAVLSAIHDLASSGFVGYNVETQLITLERRIFG